MSDIVPLPDPQLGDFREWFSIDIDFVDFEMTHETFVPFIECTLTFRRNRPFPHQPVDLMGGHPVMDSVEIELHARRYYPIDIGSHAFFVAWGRHYQEHGAGGVFEYRTK